jgi:hypothetical protein
VPGLFFSRNAGLAKYCAATNRAAVLATIHMFGLPKRHFFCFRLLISKIIGMRIPPKEQELKVQLRQTEHLLNVTRQKRPPKVLLPTLNPPRGAVPRKFCTQDLAQRKPFTVGTLLSASTSFFHPASASA